jgi:23S rRNA (adenine2503-C2)-methyltransferase
VTINLLDLTPGAAADAVRTFAVAHGQPGYRAAQVVRRLWQMPARSFAEMTDLPKAFRLELETQFSMPRLEIASRQRSADGTEKFLFRLHDGQHI